MYKKIAGYARVSSDEQKKNGFSIDGQKNSLKEAATQNNEEISEWFVDDGFSGSNLKRPAIKNLLIKISTGEINKIYVTDSDRLTRNIHHNFSLHKAFERYNIEVCCLSNDWISMTPEQEMFSIIKTSFSQTECRKASPRTIAGLTESARQYNYCIGGLPPRGYRRVPNPKSKKPNGKKLEIREEYVSTIIEIFESIAERSNTVHGLARKLNKEKFDGVKWNDNTILQIVQNPIYYGCLHTKWFHQEFHQQAFVTKEIWMAANNSLKTISKQKKNIYLYKGMVKCADCNVWTINDTTLKKKKNSNVTINYLYYECPNCRKRINEKKLNELIYPTFRAEWKNELNTLKKIKEMDSKLKKLKRQLELLGDDYESNLISENDYVDERRTILLKIKQREKQLSTLKRMDLDEYDALSKKEKRFLIRKYISSCRYSFENKKIKIYTVRKK